MGIVASAVLGVVREFLPDLCPGQVSSRGHHYLEAERPADAATDRVLVVLNVGPWPISRSTSDVDLAWPNRVELIDHGLLAHLCDQRRLSAGAGLRVRWGIGRALSILVPAMT